MTHGPLNLDDLRRRARQALEQATSRTQAHPAFQEYDWPKLLEELSIYQAELEIQNDELANAQNDIVSSLTKYRQLFEHLPQPAVLLDSRGFIEEANVQAIRFLGLHPLAALHRISIVHFFDFESRAGLHTLLRAAPEREPTEPPRLHVRTSDGEFIPCAVHAIALPGEVSETVRILLVMADLRAELAVRESERNLRRVLEHAPIPMASYRLGERREFVFVNREFTQVFGYTREDVPTVDHWASQAFPDPAYRRQSFAWWDQAVEQAIREQGTVPSREFRVVRKDRGICDVEISAALADDCVIVSFLDFTHRNEIEQQLRISEERHRQWAHNSADVVWTMNLEGQITYMSPAVMTTQGRTPEEAMATPWEEMFTPDSLAVVQQGFAQAVADIRAGRAVRFHERLEERRKDGGTTWTDVKATSLFDQDGRFLAILGIDRDITEQKRIEDESRATRDRLNATLNALPDLMFRVDRQSRILDCHLAAGATLPLPPDEIIGRTLAEILPESARRVVLEALEEAADRGFHRGGAYAVSTTKGVVWHELSIAAMGDGTTEEAEFILLARDITRRKQREEALRLSEERHRILAENTRDVIWAMQLDGTITYISPAVEQVRGVTPEEAMRQPIEEILRPAAQAAAIGYLQQLIAALQAGERPPSYRGEQEYYRKGGGTFWAEVTAIPILREDGSFVELLGVSRDIDERKCHEHELQLARDAAHVANQAKSRFLAHMSHEIRIPMNGVLGMAQILAQEGLAADHQQMVDSILSAGRSLLGIINDILDLSKIEAGQLQLDPQPFDLNQTLAHVVSIGGVNARAKGIELRLEADPAIAGGWLGDALRLEQVLFNLAGNAIKFTKKGEVVIHVRPLEHDAGHGRLRFEIADTGIGMDAEAVARLFTPFSQADASISRRFGGTGLGLSISKRLVELMGGEIGVRSTPEVGSVFWFDWPASRVAAPEPEAFGGNQGKPQGGIDLHGLRVLVVDDSAINRAVAQRALKLRGVDVTLANDGEQALSRLREKPNGYDVVLMDIQMPVMDGLAAVRAIREEPALAGLPVLALSAGVLEEERESALAAGMNDFITKPLDLQQLNVSLARFLPGAMATTEAE